MSHELVRFYTDDDGESVPPYWHLIQFIDAPRALCSGLVFGIGEGSAHHELKTVKRGGITCPSCLKIIKEFKGVKL